MPRTLVTGATGFVGSNLVAHLCRQNWDVRCLVRDQGRAAPLEAQGAKLFIGSLGDAESIVRAADGVDVVFHLAGRVRALNSREFTEDNVEGTRRVVQACQSQERSPVVVFASSIAAAGPNVPGQPHCETDRDAPISDYGRSKLAAEQAVRGFAEEVPISIVRPPIVFGPADPASLKIFTSVRLTRMHLIPGFRKFPVSVVYVDDLCDALVRIAEQGRRVVPTGNNSSDDATGTYYVAAERTLKYGDLGKLAARAIGCRVLAIPLPKAFFWAVGGAVELLGQVRRTPAVLGLDKMREAVAPAWECSDEKIRRELGYLPGPSLEEQFNQTAAWYREHGWL